MKNNQRDWKTWTVGDRFFVTEMYVSFQLVIVSFFLIKLTNISLVFYLFAAKIIRFFLIFSLHVWIFFAFRF